MLALGIETSCDETSCAVVEDGCYRKPRILSNIVSSSIHLHRKYGGVIPEIASRHHVEMMPFVFEEALKKARVRLVDIDLIAVTKGPGLVGALLVGIEFAKSLSYASGIPIIGVDHLKSHIWAALLNGEKIKFPFVALIVSGGHTSLLYVKDELSFKSLGRTVDDAAGEAFDKVAKLLGLGYPGGPVIAQIAKRGAASFLKLPRGIMKNGSSDFSFSGIKTAVLYHLRDSAKDAVADIAASFQEAVCDSLVEKALTACHNNKCRSLVVGGGVAANERLRAKLCEAGIRENVKVHFAPPKLSTDNAAMVALFGLRLYKRGIRSDMGLTADVIGELGGN